MTLQDLIDKGKLVTGLGMTALSVISQLTKTRTDDTALEVLTGIDKVLETLGQGMTGEISEEEAIAQIKSMTSDTDARMKQELRDKAAAKWKDMPK